jgi:hypothetical protein
MIGVVGTATEAVEAVVITGDVAIMTDVATTADRQTNKKRRMKRRFFVPAINPTG